MNSDLPFLYVILHQIIHFDKNINKRYLKFTQDFSHASIGRPLNMFEIGQAIEDG